MASFDPRGNSVNTVNIAGVYPRMGGQSTGVDASALSDGSALGMVKPQMMAKGGGGGGGMAPNTDVARAVAVGSIGSPAAWWLSLAAALFLLMFFAKRFGSEAGAFSNIKLSVYNVVVIALAAIIGMTLLKGFFTKFPVPGLSTLVLAA